jgi:hypothetical protein
MIAVWKSRKWIHFSTSPLARTNRPVPPPFALSSTDFRFSTMKDSISSNRKVKHQLCYTAACRPNLHSLTNKMIVNLAHTTRVASSDTTFGAFKNSKQGKCERRKQEHFFGTWNTSCLICNVDGVCVVAKGGLDVWHHEEVQESAVQDSGIFLAAYTAEFT